MKLKTLNLKEPVREPGKSSAKLYYTAPAVSGIGVDSITVDSGWVYLRKGEDCTVTPVANVKDAEPAPPAKK